MLVRPLLVALCAVTAAWAQTLGGQVLEDHSDTPLPSANIRIARPGEKFLAAELETDREGRFQATGLAPGEYRLDIRRPGYASATLSATLTAAGATVTARLIKRGVITGSVRDQQGQPIPGALVYALPKASPLRPPGRNTASATADGSGAYRIRNLLPGEYTAIVSVGASTYAMGSAGSPGTLARIGSGFSAFPTNSRPDTLSITGGEELRNIDFTVLARPLLSVSGKVDPKAEGAFFILALIDPAQPGLAVAVTESAADGSFKFTGIPAGNYRLVAATTARARNTLGFILSDQPFFGTTPVNLAAQDLTGLVVNPNAARSVTIQLRSTAGCPAAAQLEMTALEDWGSQLGRTISLKSGEATVVTGLAPARYALSTPSAAPITCYLESDSVLDLAEGAPSAPVDAVFAPAATVRGTLRAPNPTAFRIALTAAGDTSNFTFAVPDAQGRFNFSGLRPGRYRIGDFPTGTRVPSFSKMTEFEVRGGSDIEIEVTQ